MRLSLFALIVSATPALAEGPMSAAEFDAYVQGKTLTFGLAGEAPYGAEHYGPGRSVVWSFLNGTCDNGQWFEEAGHICFVYEQEPGKQCWDFYADPEGIRAVFVDDPTIGVLYEAKEGKPLTCPGPDLTS